MRKLKLIILSVFIFMFLFTGVAFANVQINNSITPTTFNYTPHLRKVLNVPLKDQKYTMIKWDPSSRTPKQLCWAASSASVIDFKNGTTNTTAEKIFDMLGYPLSYLDTGGGGVENALPPYGIQYDFKDGLNKPTEILSFDQIKNIIDGGNPIIASSSTYNGSYAHATVICGYDTNDGATPYLIQMDSSGSHSGEPIYSMVEWEGRAELTDYNGNVVKTGLFKYEKYMGGYIPFYWSNSYIIK